MIQSLTSLNDQNYETDKMHFYFWCVHDVIKFCQIHGYISIIRNDLKPNFRVVPGKVSPQIILYDISSLATS